MDHSGTQPSVCTGGMFSKKISWPLSQGSRILKCRLRACLASA